MSGFKRFIIILNVVFLVLITIFITQNGDIATIKFLFWTYKSSLSIILFSTFILGIIIGLLSFVPLLIKERKKNKGSDQEETSHDSENHDSNKVP